MPRHHPRPHGHHPSTNPHTSITTCSIHSRHQSSPISLLCLYLCHLLIIQIILIIPGNAQQVIKVSSPPHHTPDPPHHDHPGSVTGIRSPFQSPSANILTDEFMPMVSARCDRGIMHIQIITSKPFYGVAHTRNHRKSPCLVTGNGSHNTTLKISLLAQQDDELYCGVERVKGHQSVSLAVRLHPTLELSEDRYFYLTCQSSPYQNIKGGAYRVNLKLLDGNTGQRVQRLIHGHPYYLKAELTPKDSITSLLMKNCFVFTKSNDQVQLIDEWGCTVSPRLITSFTYNDTNMAQAYIADMFKFSNDQSKVHFQCDAVLCREDSCLTQRETQCQTGIKRDQLQDAYYSQLSTSTSVWIREPSELDSLAQLTGDSDSAMGRECTEWRFPWLITLCICLAIMLLVMLLLNLFMCSSLTCRCMKSDLNEKDGLQYEDEYEDPYRADWTAPNSLHGSRYSLQQRQGDTDSDNTSIGHDNRMQHHDDDYHQHSLRPIKHKHINYDEHGYGGHGHRF